VTQSKLKKLVQFVNTGLVIVGGETMKGTPTDVTRLAIWLIFWVYLGIRLKW
jgi:hypothetical protein